MESSVDVTVQALTNQTVSESTELQNINKEMCDVYFIILQMLLLVYWVFDTNKIKSWWHLQMLN